MGISRPAARRLPAPPRYEVVALAASAGGLQALSHVLAALPKEFPAAVVVVQHLLPNHRSHLAEILARRTPLRVKEAEEGDLLEPGAVYVAPPDRHLLVRTGGGLTHSESALVHFLRPSADLLFESVAQSYGARAIAVVLSGSGADGAVGIRVIKSSGGMVLAQDEATSEFFGMPGAAAETGSVDRVLALDEIGPELVKLVTGRDDR